MANLFVRKSIAALKAEAAVGGDMAETYVVGYEPDDARHRIDYRRGHLLVDRQRGGVQRRSRDRPLIRAGRHRPRVRRLCYAEMASTVPIAGSAYTYAYATMGEFIAWIIGWDLILEYALGAVTVSISWSGYVVSFLEKNLGFKLPAAYTTAPYAFKPGVG